MHRILEAPHTSSFRCIVGHLTQPRAKLCHLMTHEVGVDLSAKAHPPTHPSFHRRGAGDSQGVYLGGGEGSTGPGPWIIYIYIYIYRIFGGVSPTGKSFRVVPCVRACVRAVWMPSENQIKFRVGVFPFSLLAAGAFPFSLVRSSESR